MPKHFTEEEKNKIRSKLIAEGLALFEKFGIDKTSINNLTKNVGISKGSFYTFFNSKGDLFMEVYRIEREKAHMEVMQEIDNSSTRLQDKLIQYSNSMRQRIKKRPILEIVYDSNALMMISDQSVRERLLQYNQEINQQMTDMIADWLTRDGTYDVKPNIITKMIRSITFLRFHDYAIGLDDFDEVVDSLNKAVCAYVDNCRQ